MFVSTLITKVLLYLSCSKVLHSSCYLESKGHEIPHSKGGTGITKPVVLVLRRSSFSQKLSKIPVRCKLDNDKQRT